MKKMHEEKAEPAICSLDYAGKEDRSPPDAPLWFKIIVTAFASIIPVLFMLSFFDFACTQVLRIR